MLKLIAIHYPLKEGEEFPELEEGTNWYKGVKHGFGGMYAQQHTPGEVWVFKIHDATIRADTPFDLGKPLTYS